MQAYRELERQITELAAQIALACKLGQSQKVKELIARYSGQFSNPKTPPPQFWN